MEVGSSERSVIALFMNPGCTSYRGKMSVHQGMHNTTYLFVFVPNQLSE